MSRSDPELVERFCKTTRWFHWTFALCFLALAVTGAVLLLQEEFSLTRAEADGWLDAHLAAAVGLLTAPWLVVLSGDTRRFLADLGEVVRFSRADLGWIALFPRTLFSHVTLPPQGKLNAGQKLNAAGTAVIGGAMLASGVQLWLEPGAYLALLIHVAGLLAWLPLFAVHFFMAVINPSTRPALRGMITGKVPRAWALHHHERWLRELDGESR